MPIEIERKFLINPQMWDKLVKPVGRLYRQGYLVNDKYKTIRVRLSTENAFITIKGNAIGATRREFEYDIPVSEARQLLDNFSIGELSKTRYEILYGNKLWEVDVFHGENEGLIVAEIELSSEEEIFTLPDWVADEVTHDHRYYNANLSLMPFKRW